MATMTTTQTSSLGPIVDDVDLDDLHTREHYDIETIDGWTLVITRYKPIAQPWHQPLLNQPLLLVHGFSQNRHAWTAGEFVKNMLYFGADLHILELRGHGLSSLAKQEAIAQEHGKALPADHDYGWNLDSYFLYDVPAAIEAVKVKTGHDKIFYAGHSMGGMIGYGLASQRSDMLGLATIGSPVDLGKESFLIQLAAWVGVAAPALWGVYGNAARSATKFSRRRGRTIPVLTPIAAAIALSEHHPDSKPNTDVVPMDLFLGKLYRGLMSDNVGLARYLPNQLKLFNPTKVADDDIDWLLQEGGEREPLAVLLTFAKWIRRREVVCYTTGYDFKANFPKIRIPITIIFGDQDVLAGVKSTRSIYLGVESEYAVWRPVRGNSHLDITMGLDIRQICYDLKNMMEYAINHQTRAPRLSRAKKKDAVLRKSDKRRQRSKRSNPRAKS